MMTHKIFIKCIYIIPYIISLKKPILLLSINGNIDVAVTSDILTITTLSRFNRDHIDLSI